MILFFLLSRTAFPANSSTSTHIYQKQEGKLDAEIEAVENRKISEAKKHTTSLCNQTHTKNSLLNSNFD
jgi:hypothetical protein